MSINHLPINIFILHTQIHIFLGIFLKSRCKENNSFHYKLIKLNKSIDLALPNIIENNPAYFEEEPMFQLYGTLLHYSQNVRNEQVLKLMDMTMECN